MTLYGYARVSTVDQDPQTQFEALHTAGVEEAHLFVDHASGTKENRPGLDRVLSEVAAGDTLVVWKLDRLGRSLSHLITVVQELGEQQVNFRSLTEAIDTTTAGGRLLFHIIGAVAEFEREIISERTKAALAVAKRNGTLGRPTSINALQHELIFQMHAAGRSQRVIAETCGLSKSAVGRVLRGEIVALADRVPTTDSGALTFYPPKQRQKRQR